MSNPLQPLQLLCENHYEWLCQWWRHQLGQGDEAADFAHDTFLRVLRNPEAVRTLRQPRAYLTTIARGLLNDHWRRRSLERAWMQAVAAMPPELEASPEMLLAVQQALQQLDRMLGNLAPQAREVFVLSQLEGLTYLEIATRTGLSDRTVKRYMAQGFEICLTMMEH